MEGGSATSRATTIRSGICGQPSLRLARDISTMAIPATGQKGPLADSEGARRPLGCGVQTNLGLLSVVMRQPSLLSGAADVGTLGALHEEELAPRLADEVLEAVAVASLLPSQSPTRGTRSALGAGTVR